jgi:RNA binding exosome subunit
MKGPIQAVEVSYLVQATEDLERIDLCVKSTLGIVSVREELQLEGHFGNALSRVCYHLTGEEAARVVEELARGLTAGARHELAQTLQRSVDEHSALYLRLDKQQLMGGRMVPGMSDPIRVKIKPRLYLVKGGAAEFYRRVMNLDL